MKPPGSVKVVASNLPFSPICAATCCASPSGRPYGLSDNLPEPWATAATREPEEAESGGLSESDELLHGYCANSDWSLVSDSRQELTIKLEYPPDSCIRSVTRTVRPVRGKPALEVSVEIVARHACARPVGFHPNFALRGKPGSFRIEPGGFAFGLTHPGADGVTQAKANARFEKLSAVPVSAGGADHFDRLPFAEDREEILQLCGINGSMRLVDEAAQVAWTLSWDPSKLTVMPSLDEQSRPPFRALEWRESLCRRRTRRLRFRSRNGGGPECQSEIRGRRAYGRQAGSRDTLRPRLPYRGNKPSAVIRHPGTGLHQGSLRSPWRKRFREPGCPELSRAAAALR